MGHIWTASRKTHQLILEFTRQHRRVTAKQVAKYLARLGYSSASTRWHLNKLAQDGRLRKIGGPTYYEASDAVEGR